jgi:hypothetical protein
MIASIASTNLAAARNDPAEKTRRPTPMLDQSTKYSIPLSDLCFEGIGSMPHSGGFLVVNKYFLPISARHMIMNRSTASLDFEHGRCHHN